MITVFDDGKRKVTLEVKRAIMNKPSLIFVTEEQDGENTTKVRHIIDCPSDRLFKFFEDRIEATKPKDDTHFDVV